MKKNNRILVCVLVILVTLSIPALVSAVYVPADDDNKPDYYYMVYGDSISGDLGDVITDDIYTMCLEPYQELSWRYGEIKYYFYYDIGGLDSEGISIDFYIDECSDSNVKIHAYGDVDGWMYLGEHTEGGYNLLLEDYEYEDQEISVIKFSKTQRWSDYKMYIDLAILNFA
ncbi:MAG: hypothetical protein EU530_03810 [Promethearchaeota archaeon]|nr:MAG: hypothetical protein EU530_03810 [Candidatus Lokiarchaeota archaeon]